MLLLVTVLFVAFSFTAASQCSTEERIMHGTNAKPRDFPYVVSIRIDGIHKCVGSILNKKHILTAAHCFITKDLTMFTVQYGVVQISNDSKTIVNVEKVFRHPKFAKRVSNANDIMIMRLKKPLTYSKFVKRIKLPKRNEVIPYGKLAWSVGWGGSDLADPSTPTPHLQKVQLRIHSNKDCEIDSCYEGIPKYHLCAGIKSEGKGPCFGDSGGPLFYRKGVPLALVSFGKIPCGTAGPGVYTRLPRYVDWIKSTLKEP